MTTDDRLAAIEAALVAIAATIDYQTKLLETIVESIPQPGRRPDIMKAMEPLLNSPLIKDNPALAGMAASFAKTMGGDNNE